MGRGFDRRTLIGGAGAMTLVGCYPKREKPQAEDGQPQFLLADLEARHGGRLGVAALDVGSQRRVSWRGQERFPFCSTFKAFLAAAILERVQRDEERLDRAVPVVRADMIPHAPVTEKAIGRTLTIRELMQAAVEVSDNPAANILIREMGGIAVWRSWWPTFGDTTTLISRLEPRGGLRRRRDRRCGTNWASGSDRASERAWPLDVRSRLTRPCSSSGLRIVRSGPILRVLKRFCIRPEDHDHRTGNRFRPVRHAARDPSCQFAKAQAGPHPRS